jgi:hypothetical protein
VFTTEVIEAARDAVTAFGHTCASEHIKGCTEDHTGLNSKVIEALIDLDERLKDDEARTDAYRLALATYLVAAGLPEQCAFAIRTPTFDLLVDDESHYWHARNALRAGLLLEARLQAA